VGAELQASVEVIVQGAGSAEVHVQVQGQQQPCRGGAEQVQTCSSRGGAEVQRSRDSDAEVPEVQRKCRVQRCRSGADELVQRCGCRGCQRW